MKHAPLAEAIGDAVCDELKGLLRPLVEAELVRQREGGDPLQSPPLAALARAPDRFKLKTSVEWSAATQLSVMADVTSAVADAIATHIAALVRETLHAQRVASGAVQREFDEFVAEQKRIPAERAAARARIEHVKNLPLCQEEARAREALAGLVASLRAQRIRRGRADTQARISSIRGCVP